MPRKLASDLTRITSHSQEENLSYFPDCMEISLFIYCLANSKDKYLSMMYFLSRLSIGNRNHGSFVIVIDDYAKNGGPGAVWTSCSFNHNPLRH